MDKFMEVHGDELPFDNPEADQPIGYIKITPPVDFTEAQKEKKITITAETKAESKEIADETKESSSKTKEKGDSRKKPAAKKAAKKTSVKDKLSAGKEKVTKAKTRKQKPDKDLQAAM